MPIQINGRSAFSSRVAGARLDHQLCRFQGRNIDYCPVANTANKPAPVRWPACTPFSYMPQSFFDQPIGQLDYNALETSLQGRSRVTGLSYLLSYTWSKGAQLHERTQMVWDWYHQHSEPI